jgi:hypothetical protein
VLYYYDYTVSATLTTINLMCVLLLLVMCASIYSVSVTIFQTFSCHDVGSQDEKEEYMTADYSVSCASERYSFAFWWAVAMVFVYPIGRHYFRR